MDITGLAALISAATRVLGIDSHRLNRRAAKQAELRDRRERPELSLYLSDAATELIDDAEYRIWRFSMLVTNRSDRENSVVRAECRISYRTTGAHTHNVAIPIYMDPRRNIVSNRELELPLRLHGRTAKAGVLSFGASNSTLAGRNIVGYVITLEDAYGKEYQVETIVVMEVSGQDDQESPGAEDQDLKGDDCTQATRDPTGPDSWRWRHRYERIAERKPDTGVDP